MEKKIIEGNKLIAEFMGYKYFQSPYGGWGFCKDEKDMSTWLHSNNILYHTSWDWLHPVIEKIIQIGDVDVDSHNWVVKISTNVSSTKSWQVTSYDYIKTMGATMIGAYYFCVVEFIQWYNTNQTSAQGE